MRVSCSCLRKTASRTLEGWIKQVGLEPIVTNRIIRVVYEGDNKALGEAIVQMFSHEADHEVTVVYSKEEQEQSARKAARKAERAERNAKLHGH